MVVVVAIIVAVVASGGGRRRQGDRHETGAVTVDGTPLPSTTRRTADTAHRRRPIPTLAASRVRRPPVTIEPTGKPQVVVFVAHWCPHCQAEVPRLVDLAKQGVFDGVDVTAVATGTNSDAPNYPPSAWLEGREVAVPGAWSTARRAPPRRRTG